MTVDSSTNRIDYAPDGLVTVFPYAFRVDSADDLVVYADGELVEDGYTVDGLGDSGGGDVTFDDAPASTIEVLTLMREVDLTQDSAYPALGPFPAASHEAALDKLTFITQQLQEQLDRAGISPIDSDESTDFTLPKYEAGGVWLWDVTEQKLVTSVAFSDYGVRKATDAEVIAGSETAADAFVDPNQLKKYVNTSVDSIAALRAITYTPVDGQVVQVLGYYTADENRDWAFRWSGDDLSTEVAAEIAAGSFWARFAPLTGTDGSTGAFVRIYAVNTTQPEWWGAIADGVTDCTVALQACVDASIQKETKLTTGTYMFSNLVIPNVTILKGSGLWDTTLKRIAGSTGIAITDAGSAAKITLKDFVLDLDDTVGTGIELGYNTFQLGVEGMIANVMVRDGAGATNYGININGNVAVLRRVSTWFCEGTALRVSGTVNMLTDIVLLGNAEHYLEISGGESIITNLHLEGGSPKPVYITGYNNTINSLHTSVSDYTNVTDIVTFEGAAAVGNNINRSVVNLKPGASVTNFVNESTVGVVYPFIGSGDYTQAGAGYLVRKITATTVLANFTSHGTIIAGDLSANADIYLPKTTKSSNQTLNIINADTTYSVKVRENTGDADGVLGGWGHFTLAPGDSIGFVCDGTKWHFTQSYPIKVAQNNSSFTTVGSAGTSLAHASLAAGCMGTNRGVRITAAGTISGSANTKTVKLQFHSSFYNVVVASAADQTDWRIEAEIVNTSATTQRISWVSYESDGTIKSGYETNTIDTTLAITIGISGSCTDAADTITQTMWLMEEL